MFSAQVSFRHCNTDAAFSPSLIYRNTLQGLQNHTATEIYVARLSEWSPSICFVKEAGVTAQLVGSTASMGRPVWEGDKEQAAPSGVSLAPHSFPAPCECHPGRSRFQKRGRSVPSRAGEGHRGRSCGRAGDSGL